MNVFRLVLFLAGLAAYLVVRQFTQTAQPTDLLPGVAPVPAAAPGGQVRPPSGGLTPAPSLRPHENTIRPEAEFVSQPLSRPQPVGMPAGRRAQARTK
jgi:hypothetical protein